MRAAQYAQSTASQDAELVFKGYILEESKGFASEPMADLYRINLLGMMLNRYDELRSGGMTAENAIRYTKHEFRDIARRMQEEGFERSGSKHVSRWPELTEDEADTYIRESDACLHKRSMGIAMNVACLVPLMICLALSEFLRLSEDVFSMLGVVGMFGMIALGVYAIVTAGKPKAEKTIRKKQFSLGSRLRRTLTQMKDDVIAHSRKRLGKGIAMIVASIIPVLIGAFLSETAYTDGWAMLGVGGMFFMIASGVYQIVMGDGEKKTIKKLLKTKDE